MSTLMTWALLIVVIVGFLVVDLWFAWRCYRDSILFENGIRPFLRWWASQSLFKLSATAAVTIIVSLALFLQEYTLALPDAWKGEKLPKVALWALLAAATVAAMVTLDLLVSWRSYRYGLDWSARDVGFFRWWGKKSVKMFCMVGVLACLALGGIRIAKHYKLMDLKHESSEYIANARLYYQAKKYTEATLELRNAIKLNRDDTEAYLWLARSYQRLGALPDARDAYQGALGIDPKLFEAHLELGWLCLAMKDRNTALSEAEQALALAAGAPEPRLLLARIRSMAGDFEQAMAQYRAILATDPANQKARGQLLTLLLDRRAFTDAVREATTLLKQNPRDMNFRIQLALAQEGEGHLSDALTTLREAARRDPAAAAPLTTQGDLLHRHRKYLPALACYEEAFQRSPDSAKLMNNIAMLHAEHGYDLKRAATLASQLYSNDPQNPAVLDTYGWVLYKQGNLRQALPLLLQAVAVVPNSPEVHYHLGTALRKAGRTVEGRKHLEQALRLSRDFDGVATARRLLGSRS